MRYFELNIVTVILRFYLMMAVVIVGFFVGIPWLAILALPILLSAMVGMQWKGKANTKVPASASKHLQAQMH